MSVPAHPVRILGISAFYHDSAACLVVDGKIIAAAQEERFTRKKHDDSFPRHSIDYCLHQGGISPAELDLVAFYEKPFLKFDRILHTYLAKAPAGLPSFLKSIPLWLKKKNLVEGPSCERDSIPGQNTFSGASSIPRRFCFLSVTV